MDFGIPTLIELNSLEECAMLCKELGLQFIELNMNLPEYQLNKIDVPKFKEIADKHGIYYTLHLDENLNVCDFNTDVAEAYNDTVYGAIGIAKQLGIPILNMHMAEGVYFTLPDKKVYLFEKCKDLYMHTLSEFRKLITGTIGDDDITICIENSGIYQDFRKEGIELLLENNKFALTLDTGHNHVRNNVNEPFIMQHKDRLIHMHIHDATKTSDHLPLGAGEIDLKKYFCLAKKNNCRVVLETKTVDGLKQSVEWVKESLK